MKRDDPPVGAGGPGLKARIVGTRQATIYAIPAQKSSLELAFHPLADIFPLIEGPQFDELVESIRSNGLRSRSTRGRSSTAATVNAPAKSLAWSLGTKNSTPALIPLQFVLDQNLNRRHLKESQRAAVAARLENMRQGRQLAKDANLHLCSRTDAAQLLNVSERSVAAASEVLEKGAAELIAAVERGEVSVSAAAELADLPENEQRETVAAGKKAVTAKAKQQKAKRQKKKRKRGHRLVLPTPSESQHDRDLKMLRDIWSCACQTAQLAFVDWLDVAQEAERASNVQIGTATDDNGAQVASLAKKISEVDKPTPVDAESSAQTRKDHYAAADPQEEEDRKTPNQKVIEAEADAVEGELYLLVSKSADSLARIIFDVCGATKAAAVAKALEKLVAASGNDLSIPTFLRPSP